MVGACWHMLRHDSSNMPSCCCLLHLQEDLQHWRTKIATNGREWEERNTALRREKELMSKHYSQLKAALDASRAASAERLKQLSVMSSNTMQVG